MKIFTRILSLVIVLLMLVTVLASCADGGNENTTTVKQEENTSESGSEDVSATEKSTERGAEVNTYIANLKDADYSGEEFVVLCRGDCWPCEDFEADEYLGMVLNDARYDRLLALESKYGITVVPVYCNGSSGSVMYARVSSGFISGMPDYDVAYGGLLDDANMAQQGYIADFYSLKNIDLSKTYWDQREIEDLTIHNRLYFAIGDAAINPIETTFVIYFNKVLANNYQLPDLYEMVDNKEWTVDEMKKYAALVGYSDNNQNRAYDDEDTFGFDIQDDVINANLVGCGSYIGIVDENGNIACTFSDTHTSDVMDKFCSWIYDDYVFHHQRTASGSAGSVFRQNRCLFQNMSLKGADSYREEMEDGFGLLPYPMYDTNQGRYYSYVHIYGCEGFVIPINLDEDALDKATILLEACAVYGLKYLTPAYYDTVLMSRTFRDNESLPMLDLIINTRSYDVGKVFNLGEFGDALLGVIRGRETNYSSAFKTCQKKIKTQINGINETFESMD